jgi:hypothetical protein
MNPHLSKIINTEQNPPIKGMQIQNTVCNDNCNAVKRNMLLPFLRTMFVYLSICLGEGEGLHFGLCVHHQL